MIQRWQTRYKQLRHYFAFCFDYIADLSLFLIRINWRDMGSTSSGKDFSMKTVRPHIIWHVQIICCDPEGLENLFEREISILRRQWNALLLSVKETLCIPVWQCIIFVLPWNVRVLILYHYKLKIVYFNFIRVDRSRFFSGGRGAVGGHLTAATGSTQSCWVGGE